MQHSRFHLRLPAFTALALTADAADLECERIHALTFEAGPNVKGRVG